MSDLAPHHPALLRLTRTDPKPRVRHRADGLLLLAGGATIGQVARLRHVGGPAPGVEGALPGRGPRGPCRPPTLGAAARALLERALGRSPPEDGHPVGTWTVADPTDQLDRRGRVVSPTTVYWTLRVPGYRSRLTRHDLARCQDAEAVASAKHALAELQKRGLLPGLASASSTWTGATCTPTPTWRRSGAEKGATKW